MSRATHRWNGPGALLLEKRVVAPGTPFDESEAPGGKVSKWETSGKATRIAGCADSVSVETHTTDLDPEPSEYLPPVFTVPVGVMDATIGAGEDGEFGTEDDEIEIKPKKRRGRRKRA